MVGFLALLVTACATGVPLEGAEQAAALCQRAAPQNEVLVTVTGAGYRCESAPKGAIGSAIEQSAYGGYGYGYGYGGYGPYPPYGYGGGYPAGFGWGFNPGVGPYGFGGERGCVVRGPLGRHVVPCY